MALRLLGIVIADPDAAGFSLVNTEEHLLVASVAEGEYQALAVDDSGNFFSLEVVNILEDDLLENYIPDPTFFNNHFAKLYTSLTQRLIKNEEPFSVEENTLFSALIMLCCNRKTQGEPTTEEFELVRRFVTASSPEDASLEFVYSLASAAIKHRKHGNHDQAIFYYMKAMDIGGENANILFNLARVYHDIGAIERAKHSLERALSLDGNMKMAKQYLDFLTLKAQSE